MAETLTPAQQVALHGLTKSHRLFCYPQRWENGEDLEVWHLAREDPEARPTERWHLTPEEGRGLYTSGLVEPCDGGLRWSHGRDDIAFFRVTPAGKEQGVAPQVVARARKSTRKASGSRSGPGGAG